MNKYPLPEIIFVSSVLVSVALFFSFFCGINAGKEMMQKRAIEAGVADWRANVKTQEPEFYFKNIK